MNAYTRRLQTITRNLIAVQPSMDDNYTPDPVITEVWKGRTYTYRLYGLPIRGTQKWTVERVDEALAAVDWWTARTRITVDLGNTRSKKSKKWGRVWAERRQAEDREDQALYDEFSLSDPDFWYRVREEAEYIHWQDTLMWENKENDL